MLGESKFLYLLFSETVIDKISLNLHSVANSLSLPAYMLQLMSTQNLPSIQEIAKAVFDNVHQDVFSKDKENFYLVGYSFGAMVAIEIAKLLEETGLRGQIVLIDGAPTFLKKLVVDQVRMQTCV